jgi:transcriptional regulator with XRE-family HTH domain
MSLTFGINLKTVRQSNGFSQKRLADLMNIPQQRVSEWECDKVEPTLRSLLKLIQVLDTSFEELTDGIFK